MHDIPTNYALDKPEGLIPYVNLTSGLEIAPPGAKLVRIQSSHLESFALWAVLIDLDYGFLFDAAICGVELHDCGSRGGEVARAQWQGIPWIMWAYQRAALRCSHDAPPTLAMVRNTNVAAQFLRVFNGSHPARDMALKKLRYVHKMTGAETLEIWPVSAVSRHDGDYDHLKKLLEWHFSNGARK